MNTDPVTGIKQRSHKRDEPLSRYGDSVTDPITRDIVLTDPSSRILHQLSQLRGYANPITRMLPGRNSRLNLTFSHTQEQLQVASLCLNSMG